MVYKDFMLRVRLTTEQMEILQEKAKKYGFAGVSEYVRFNMFLPCSFMEKLDYIYKTLCEEDGPISEKQLQKNEE